MDSGSRTAAPIDLAGHLKRPQPTVNKILGDARNDFVTRPIEDTRGRNNLPNPKGTQCAALRCREDLEVDACGLDRTESLRLSSSCKTFR